MATSIPALLAALALAGCAALVPKLAPPELRTVRVDVVRVALPELSLRLALTLHNPNDVPAAVDALDATVKLEGEPVGDAHLPRPVTLPAGGGAVVELDARVDVSRALAVAGRALGSGRLAVPYEIAGVVTLADGRRFPFSRRGTTGESRGGTTS